MIRYIPFEEQLFLEEVGNYQTFGICAYAQQGDEWHEVRKISDVSVELDFVAALCDKCNAGQLSPLHLLDAVEDAL